MLGGKLPDNFPARNFHYDFKLTVFRVKMAGLVIPKIHINHDSEEAA